MVTIAVLNCSTLINDATVQKYMEALQAQIADDFAPIWAEKLGLDAIGLQFFTSMLLVPKDAWPLVFYDDSDVKNALGYHQDQTIPFGKIFVRDDIECGTPSSITMSHEGIEMLGDNVCSKTVTGPDNKLYAFELCDPPENFYYSKNGVLVSNFVFPSYFDINGRGPYDFMGKISKPFEILPGGYQSVFDGTQWTQITARLEDTSKKCRWERCCGGMCRRERRSKIIPKLGNLP